MATAALNPLDTGVFGQPNDTDPLSSEVQATQLLQTKTEELHDRLSTCPRGEDGWRDYEDICKDILEFSLKDCFRFFGIDTQHVSWDGHQRMDILIDNHPANPTGFWHEVQVSRVYGADKIIFECKNYSKGVEAEQVLQVKSYDIANAKSFRVILTREMPKQSGINAIKHWWQYYQIRILLLTDEDMHKLIDARINSDAIRAAEEVFYASTTGIRRPWYDG